MAMPAVDINAELLKQLSDEIEDSNKYFKLSTAATCPCQDSCDKEHNEHVAKCLWEISLEEYTHAKWIHGHLVKSCVTIPDDVEHKYQALKNRAEEMYEPEIMGRIRSIIETQTR